MGVGGKSTGPAGPEPFDLDSYAGGEVIDGIPDFYDAPEEVTGQESRLTWAGLLEQWALIEPDLHSEYGIDVHSGILTTRPKRWLQARIAGLLMTDSRLARHIAAQAKQPTPEGG